MATTPFTTYAFAGTGRPSSPGRTMPDRVGDVFNVKDYGAKGDGSNDDRLGIQAAFTAMWGSTIGAGTVYFPPGDYKILTDDGTGSAINIGHAGGSNTSGRVLGAGREAVNIDGTLHNGFIFYQDDSTNGPEEISNLSITNASDWIGSGALRISNSSVVCNLVHFRGMIGVLLPFNIYDAAFNNCTGNAWSDTTTGYIGTLGIAGYAPHIKNWRSTTEYQACFQLYGGNGCHIDGCGIEQCDIGILAGMAIGWASHCTVSGDILTVGGTLGTTVDPFIGNGVTVFGRGLNMPAWGSDPQSLTNATYIIQSHADDGSLTGTGGLGTYRLNSGGYSITTPIPIWTRFNRIISGLYIGPLQTESCINAVYLNQVGTGAMIGCGGAGPASEPVNMFGVKSLTSRAGIYLGSVSNFTIIGSGSGATTYLGAIVVGGSCNNVTFIDCTGTKALDNTITAKISGDAGTGTGTLLTVTAWSGSGLGVGMRVSNGSTVNTHITANNGIDGALTGFNQTGTYRVADSLSFASGTLTVYTGADWVMPTAPDAKTGIKFINCGATVPPGITSGLNTLNMTFTSLPGEAGASTGIPRVEGQEYAIVDGAKKTAGGTAAIGDATQGGGTQHIKVWFNGTDWIRFG